MTDRASHGKRGPVLAAVAIAAVATAVFFHRPATAPRGYLEDFVSLALNAFCVSQTGADEYGVRLPVVAFQSFGDFKSTANLYGLAAWYRLAPDTLPSARVYSLLLGYAALALILVVLHREGTLARLHAPPLAAAAFALALLSSWALVTDRVLVEVTTMDLTLALALTSAVALLRQPGSMARGVLAGIAAGLLAYNYSPAKVVYVLHVPLVLAAYALGARRSAETTLSRVRGLALFAAVSIVLGLPHLWDLAHGARGIARFEQVEGRISPLRIAAGLAVNFNPVFLFVSGDPNIHHHHGRGGMLNVFFAPWLAVGVLDAARRAWRDRDPFAAYWLGLAVATFVPAGLAERSPPHALRTHLAFVVLVGLAIRGLAAARERAMSPPRAKAWIAAVALSLAVGAVQAALDVNAFFTTYSERNLWADTGPHPRWNRAKGRPPYDDHRPESIGERFHRAAAGGDLGYCGGPTTAP